MKRLVSAAVLLAYAPLAAEPLTSDDGTLTICGSRQIDLLAPGRRTTRRPDPAPTCEVLQRAVMRRDPTAVEETLLSLRQPG
jgi:hypothetical protein